MLAAQARRLVATVPREVFGAKNPTAVLPDRLPGAAGRRRATLLCDALLRLAVKMWLVRCMWI